MPFGPGDIPKKDGSTFWGFTRGRDRHRRHIGMGSHQGGTQQRLKAVIQRCKDIHMTLNKEKCSFGSSKVVCLGHIISADGISPDPEKVKAIDQMPPPEDKKGVERLLGLLNYVAKFIPDLSSITQPIRELLKKEVMFHWDHEQETDQEKNDISTGNSFL